MANGRRSHTTSPVLLAAFSAFPAKGQTPLPEVLLCSVE